LIGGFWFTFILYYQQLQGHFDPFGRIVTVGTVVNMDGWTIGPANATAFLSDYAFETVIWLGLACLVMALVLVIPDFTNND